MPELPQEIAIYEGDLIDTQWNVNSVDEMVNEYEYYDLIDTQWNVNQLESLPDKKDDNDLIDTQLNVNDDVDTKVTFMCEI